MRWDNLVIIGVALSVCVLTVPWLLTKGAKPVAKPLAPIADSDARDSTTSDDDAVAPAAGTVTSLEEANERVQQARTLMMEGRFDEAAAQLANIGGALSDQSGAGALRDENARRQGEFEQLEQKLRDAATASDWATVASTAVRLRQLSPLPADLAAIASKGERNIAAERAYQGALQLFQAGDMSRALEAAQRGYNRYGNPEFATLVTQINGAQAHAGRRRSGGGGVIAGGGGTTAAPSTSTTGAGGSAATGAGAGSLDAGPALGGTGASTGTGAGNAAIGTTAPVVGTGVTAGGVVAGGGLGLTLDPALMQQLNQLIQGSLGGNAGTLDSYE